MRIENHRLVSEGEVIKLEWIPDAYHRKLPEPPKLAVIHYTVGLGARQVARFLAGKEQEYLSAHLLICRTGLVIQMVPFDHVAYHCGESSYRGQPKCNDFALGIELENPGPVFRQADGTWRTVQNQVWDGEVVEAKHKRGPSNWTHWGGYSDEQLTLCGHIVELWKQTYGVPDVLGHDDIAPGRKFDPGPAFPLNVIQRAVYGDAYFDRI